MASTLEEELRCPVCRDVCRDPVILSCSHSFCKDCLQSWWRENQERECPVCQTVSSKAEPPSNVVLKNLCEAFLQQRDLRESLCSLHSKKLELFCLDHQQPVCAVCRDSEEHTGHRIRPIEEIDAAQLHKKKLQETLQLLKEKLEVFEGVKVKFDQTAEHVKVQARCSERQIKDQFKKLHQFLEEEEEARLAALREEEERKSQMMKEEMEALSRKIAALSHTVRDTEDELRAEDVSFLHNYKAAVERVQQHLLLEDPQLHSGALIDQDKHLGNLTFNIWNKMKDMVSYTPVILDPNTAGLKLILSEDLTSVRTGGQRQQLPDNPERCDALTVMGAEGFTSGTHSWDVEVGDSESWILGVMRESAPRRGDIIDEFWGLQLYEYEYVAIRPPEYLSFLWSVWDLERKFHRIRVTLDCDKGELSFTDLDINAHIHTSTHTVTERVFPLIEIVGEGKMLPVNFCVTVDQSS